MEKLISSSPIANAPYPGVIVHIGKCEQGTLRVGETRHRLRRLQTAHAASKTTTRRPTFSTGRCRKSWGPISGKQVRLSKTKRLRFDFNHHKALSKEELHQIEDLVNEKIREDQPVKAYELSYEEAQKRSDIKQFFGEKYGAKVRVIDIDFSKELCGGTHTSRTGTIGFFRIAKEGSIAAGVRRIEAVTGKAAEEFAARERKTKAKSN